MAWSHSGSKSVSRSGDNLIDGLLVGERWSSGEIFYSATDSPRDYGFFDTYDEDGDGFNAEEDEYAPLTERQIRAVFASLDTDADSGIRGGAGFSVEGFTGLRLTHAGPGSRQAEIRIANSDDPAGAYAYTPARLAAGGDVWFGGAGGNPVAGNYDHTTVLHELGHALGLKHGHERQSPFDRLPLAYDSPEYTVMTYRAFVGADLASPYGPEKWGNAQSYMMLDIATLQYMYDANYAVNAGNTTYSWGPSSGETYVDDAVGIAPGGNRIFATIWDGGGVDSYDLSAYRADVDIDLRPGAHSVFSKNQLAHLGGGPNDGLARGNIFNALLHQGDKRSLIENAKGGRGDDAIRGNVTDNKLKGGRGEDTLAGGKGNDTLIGGRGADRLQGAAGDDIFRFSSYKDTRGSDADVIVKGGGTRAFQGAGKAGGDLIDLSRIDADTALSGDQAFAFAEKKAAGAIWLRDRGDETWVRGDRNGDTSPDFLVRIADAGVMAEAYSADDFLL